jgi:capsular exopolysaccharide synthesis family protein
MSRIFDALQRAGVEQSGVEYQDVASMVKVLENPTRPVSDALETPDQVPTPVLQTLAEAPAQESADAALAKFPALEVSVAPLSRLVFLTEPQSIAVEKFRFLGVRLRQLRQSRPLKTILITSTIPEEGKSLISANLAGVLARKKEKVLLIEGDLRRPVLAKQFGLGKLPGLVEWFQKGLQPANIYRLVGPDFWLMPGGDPPANPLELMQSGKLSQLMRQLAHFFDWIVVDSPPLLPLADTTLWARLTDGVLLVAREGVTQKQQLERGLEILKKSELLGVVLNSCSDSNEENYYQRYSPGKK